MKLKNKNKLISILLVSTGILIICGTYIKNNIKNVESNEKISFSKIPIQEIENNGFKLEENYLRIDTNKKYKDKKIHIKEYFWYGCPHCYNIEYKIKDVLKKYPDIVLEREHPGFGDKWRSDARIFYALKELNLEDKYHNKIIEYSHNNFLNRDLLDAIDDKNDLESVKLIIDKQEDKIDKTNSDMKNSRILGVPTFVFNDEIIFSMGKSNEKLFLNFIDSVHKHYLGN